MIGLCPLPWTAKGSPAGVPSWGMPEGVRSIIDTRSIADSEKQGEYGDYPHVLMFADGDVKEDGWELLSDGDARDARVDQKLLDKLESLLGVRAEGDTLADLILWHLTVNADPKGFDRCKPLMPTTKRQLEVQAGVLLVSRDFTMADPHANQVLAVLQDNFRKTFETVQDQKAPADLHLKVLDYWCDKFRIEKTDRSQWEKLVPVDLRTEIEGPVKHSTTVSDNFNRADAALTTPWAGIVGTHAVVSNQLKCSSAPGHAYYDSALSSDDMEVVVTLVTRNTDDSGGPFARKVNSTTETGYFTWCDGAGGHALYKTSGGSATSLGSGGTWSNGDILLVGADGSTIYSKKNGTVVHSVTDTGITGNNYGGFRIYTDNGAGTTARWDDWQAADISAAPTTRAQLIGGGIGSYIVGA